MREQSDNSQSGSATAGSGASGDTPEVFLLQAHLHEVHAILRKQVTLIPRAAAQARPGMLSPRPLCAAAHGRLARSPLPSRARPAPQSKENLDLKSKVAKAEGELAVLREELQRSREEAGRLHQELGRAEASHRSELDRHGVAHQSGDVYAVYVASIL